MKTIWIRTETNNLAPIIEIGKMVNINQNYREVGINNLIVGFPNLPWTILTSTGLGPTPAQLSSNNKTSWALKTNN